MSMTTSIPEIEPWQIRIAYVELSDKPGKGKSRPVLVLSAASGFAYCLKITSQGLSKDYPRMRLDSDLLGLAKPSWIQFVPIYKIPVLSIRDLISKIPIELAEEIDSIVRFMNPNSL